MIESSGARESAGSAAAVDDRDDPYASAALRTGADHSPSAPSSKVRGAIAVFAQNTDLLLVVLATKRAAKRRAMADPVGLSHPDDGVGLPRLVVECVFGAVEPQSDKEVAAISRRSHRKIGSMNRAFALRAYQPLACRVYPPAAAP